MAADILGEYKTTLDRLGRTRGFLNTLLSLGTAVAEVIRIDCLVPHTSNHSLLKVGPYCKSGAGLCECPLQGKTLLCCLSLLNLHSAPRGWGRAAQISLGFGGEYGVYNRLCGRRRAVREARAAEGSNQECTAAGGRNDELRSQILVYWRTRYFRSLYSNYRKLTESNSKSGQHNPILI